MCILWLIFFRKRTSDLGNPFIFFLVFLFQYKHFSPALICTRWASCKLCSFCNVWINLNRLGWGMLKLLANALCQPSIFFFFTWKIVNCTVNDIPHLWRTCRLSPPCPKTLLPRRCFFVVFMQIIKFLGAIVRYLIKCYTTTLHTSTNARAVSILQYIVIFVFCKCKDLWLRLCTFCHTNWARRKWQPKILVLGNVALAALRAAGFKSRIIWLGASFGLRPRIASHNCP